MADEISEKKEQISRTYDEMFTKGGLDGVFDLPYHRSPYYPLFNGVLKILRKYRAQEILEVGCGTGSLAHFIQEKTNIRYRGFDFSRVAVEKARLRLNSPELFYIANATARESYKPDYDTIVCTEVLEHIEQDLDVVSQWCVDSLCVCSVPNFDSPYHVRCFNNTADVVERYGQLIDIRHTLIIKKPVLSDLAVSNYIRHLRWNRYRPRRLIDLLGFGDFSKVGGWFLFAGRRL